MIAYRKVADQALTLPEVVESTSYGTPALKVRDKLMIRLKEDGETLVVRCSWEDRERLLAVYPDMFFVTDHYLGHPWVLMRLARVGPPVFKPVLRAAWRLCASRSLLKANPDLLD